MTQIIVLQVGQCGNRIGQFWQRVLNQHAISSTGQASSPVGRVHSYFQEQKKSFTPRCLQVDLGPDCLDKIACGSLGKLYRMENQVQGDFEVDGTWAAGAYGQTTKAIDSSMDTVRRLFQQSDFISGMQFSHSITGCVGSGFGCDLITRVNQAYPQHIIQSFTHFPSISNNIIEIYNTVLSIQALLEKVTMVNYFQNENIKQICIRENRKKVGFGEMNSVVARAMAGSTISMRFPGSLNTSLRKLATNLVPLFRLHFIATGLAPIGKKSYSAADMMETAYSKQSLLADTDWRQGEFYSTANIFTGGFSTYQIQQQLNIFYQKNQKRYVALHNPNHLSLSESANCPPSLTSFINNTSFRLILRPLFKKFKKMLSRRAFLHHYLKHGMEEIEFTQAQDVMGDLVADYPDDGYYARMMEWMEGEEDGEEGQEGLGQG